MGWAAAQEAYFADKEVYASSIESLPGFPGVSDGVSATILTYSPTQFGIEICHPGGTQWYIWRPIDNSWGVDTYGPTGSRGTCF